MTSCIPGAGLKGIHGEGLHVGLWYLLDAQAHGVDVFYARFRTDYLVDVIGTERLSEGPAPLARTAIQWVDRVV